jgi:hypothetical protein
MPPVHSSRRPQTPTRSSRTRRRPAPGRLPGRTALRSPSPPWPRIGFWVAVLLQQFGRAPMYGHLRFQLADPPLGRGEFRPLQRAQPGFEPAVDPLLAAPARDRLLADPRSRATSASYRPVASRSTTRRRNSAGYPRCPVHLVCPRCPSLRIAAYLSTIPAPLNPGQTRIAGWLDEHLEIGVVAAASDVHGVHPPLVVSL